MSQYVPVPVEAIEKTLDIISELRERNAKLVAALEEILADFHWKTRNELEHIIREALAQQSTEKS